MKKLYSLLLIIVVLSIKKVNAQNIAVNDNGASPDTTAMLDVSSTTKGFLVPRMTAAQRNAIPAPAEGLMVYATTDSSFYYYKNGWNRLSRANEGWNINGNAGTDPSKHFIGTTDGAPIHFRIANENAGFMNTSHNNTAYGRYTLDSIDNSSVQNTAIGANAIKNMTTGYYNSALGSGAGYNLKEGIGNTFIGTDSGTDSTSISYATALGYGARVNKGYSMILGAPGTRVGIGISRPYSQLCNSDSNLLASDGLGGNPQSLTWQTAQQGYAQLISNKSSAVGANGLAVKIANASSGTLLDLSTGNYSTEPGKTIMVVKGNGRIGVGQNNPATMFANIDVPIAGSDAAALAPDAIDWKVNNPGYAQGIYNGHTANNANGLAVKIAGTSTSNTILDLSTGNAINSQGKTVMIAKGSGNIGINTTYPIQKLDVNGNIAMNDSVILLRAGWDTFHYVKWSPDVDGPKISGYAGGSLSGRNGNILYWRYDNKVGILNSNPQQALDVAGKATIRDSLGIGISSPTAQLQLSNTTQNRKIVLYSDAVNDHEFYGLGINSSTLRYQVSGLAASHVFYSAISSSSSLELLRIKGNGRIGIGQVNPVCQLTNSDSNIIASDGLGINTPSQSWSIRAQGYIQGLYNGQTGFGRNGLAVKIAGTTSSNTLLDLSTGASFTDPGTAVMTVRGNGNVGIGTNSPVQKLDVKGNSVIRDSVGIGTTTPLQALDIRGKAYIRDSIGIGISNPTAQLQLSNLVQNRKIVLYNDNSNDHNFYGFGISASTLRYQVSGINAHHVFYAGTSVSASQELFRINGDGYIGVGISNPITKFSNTATNILGGDGFGLNTGSISWDMNMAGYIQGIYNQSSGIGSNGLAVKVAGNTASNIILDLSTGVQDATGSSIMQVRGNGNVSIGTTASTEKLSVNGAVKITDGGYGSITNNAVAPIPTGGAGTMVFSNNHFFGWTGTAWKQLDN